MRAVLTELSLEEMARVRYIMAKFGCTPGSNLVTVETEDLLKEVDEIRNHRATLWYETACHADTGGS